jgi:hypothetical protein
MRLTSGGMADEQAPALVRHQLVGQDNRRDPGRIDEIAPLEADHDFDIV